MNKSLPKESFVTCTNSQGLPVRGSLMHLNGQTAVFEVYNPFSLLQMSEVLKVFDIHIRERSIYSGKAVIRSLLNTGIMLVAEATLVDAWQDLDILSLLRNTSKFRDEVSQFVVDWQPQKSIIPKFKVYVTDFHSFLSDLSLWLEQVEVAIHQELPEKADEIRMQLVDEVTNPIRSELRRFLDELNELAGSRIPEELGGLHKAYMRRELHPFTLCSPFVHRAYTKPLGYAGDYGMIDMLLTRSRAGTTVYAKAVNELILETEPAEAHRNRITILVRLLKQEYARACASGRPFEVLNIGCGPGKEVRDFIQSVDITQPFDITLLDFSPEALAFCRTENEKLLTTANSNVTIRYVEKSIDQMLRESIGKSSGEKTIEKSYDFVYCAGLFDYLIDSVCKRLISLFYSWLRPGGLLSVTNIHPSNPQRNLMEYLLEWNVIHREIEHLKRLDLTDGEKDVISDETGVNVFLNIRKPNNDPVSVS